MKAQFKKVQEKLHKGLHEAEADEEKPEIMPTTKTMTKATKNTKGCMPNVYDGLVAHTYKYKHGKVPAGMVTQPFINDGSEEYYQVPWFFTEYNELERIFTPPYLKYNQTHTPTIQDYLRAHPNMTRKGKVFAETVYKKMIDIEEPIEGFPLLFGLVFQTLKMDEDYLKEMQYLGDVEKNKYLRGDSYPDEKILPKWARNVEDWDKYDREHQELPKTTAPTTTSHTTTDEPQKKGLKQLFQKKGNSERKHPIKDMINKIKNKKTEQGAGIGTDAN